VLRFDILCHIRSKEKIVAHIFMRFHLFELDPARLAHPLSADSCYCISLGICHK